MSTKAIKTYEKRWKLSVAENDSNILSFSNPKNQSEFFYLYYNKLINSLIKKKKFNLLEIGCGRGTASLFIKLHNKNCTPHLLDFSKNAIEIAKKNFKSFNQKASFYNCDIESFNSKIKFDIIISLGVLEHIKDIEKTLNTISPHLKNNGTMIHMIVPEKKSIQNYFNFLNRFFSRFNKKKKWLDKETFSKTDQVFRSTLSSSNYLKTFKKLGYLNSKKIEVNPFPTISNIPKIIEKILVRLYLFILLIRKVFFKIPNPFQCSVKISRAHFIVAKK